MKQKILVFLLLFLISCTINFYTGREIKLLLKEINYVDINHGYPLHKAVEIKNMKLVAYLINKGADINKKDQNGNTPLHIAVKLWAPESNYDNNRKILRYLLENGADVNAIDKEGNTPLLLSIKELNRYVHDESDDYSSRLIFKSTFTKVNLLLKYGANPNIKNNMGALPIFALLRKKSDFNSYERVKLFNLLLENGADLNLTDRNGQTILHLTVKYQCEEFLKDILAKDSLRAMLNIKDKHGDLPLHLAARLRSITLWELLLSYYDLNALLEFNNNYELPIHPNDFYFISKVAKKFSNRILKNKKNYRTSELKSLLFRIHFPGHGNLLHIAATGENADFVRFLLNNDFNVNSPTDSGYTALHYAVKFAHPDIVKILLEYGGDPNLMNVKNETPLLLAAKIQQWALYSNDQVEIVQMLFDYGAEASKAQKALEELAYIHELTLNRLIWEKRKRNLEKLVDLFVEHGLDINGDAIKGLTDSPSPLHNAAYYQNKIMVEVLLKKGADPNRYWKKNLPLHMAIASDYLNDVFKGKEKVEEIKFKIVRLLIEHGSEIPPPIQINYKYVASPVEFALEKGYDRIAKYLISHIKNKKEYIDSIILFYAKRSSSYPSYYDKLINLLTR